MRIESQYFPITAASDSVEGLLRMHRSRCPWIYWLILIGIVTAFVSLPLVQLDVTISAQGMVRPIHEKVDLRSAISGHITRVLVEDNEVVQAGQVLMQFDSKEIDERMAYLENQIRRHGILHEDLVLLIRMFSPISSELGRDFAEGSSDTWDESLFLNAITVQAVQTPHLHAEIEQLRAKLSANGIARSRARKQQARYETLAIRGLVTRQELEDARSETAKCIAEDTLLVELSISNWQVQLRKEEDSLAQLRSDYKRIQEEKQHFVLKSPLNGVVIGLTGWSPGAYAQLGQVFGSISPSTNLVVESFVSPRDIGLIKIGQKVRLQVDSFPYTQWGMLNGSVIDVGKDLSTESGSTFPSYKVTIRPETTLLKLSKGVTGALRKGMTLVARYRVSRRSLLQIIYEDSSVWINPYQGVTPSPP